MNENDILKITPLDMINNSEKYKAYHAYLDSYHLCHYNIQDSHGELKHCDIKGGCEFATFGICAMDGTYNYK